VVRLVGFFWPFLRSDPSWKVRVLGPFLPALCTFVCRRGDPVECFCSIQILFCQSVDRLRNDFQPCGSNPCDLLYNCYSRPVVCIGGRSPCGYVFPIHFSFSVLQPAVDSPLCGVGQSVLFRAELRRFCPWLSLSCFFSDSDLWPIRDSFSNPAFPFLCFVGRPPLLLVPI